MDSAVTINFAAGSGGPKVFGLASVDASRSARRERGSATFPSTLEIGHQTSKTGGSRNLVKITKPVSIQVPTPAGNVAKTVNITASLVLEIPRGVTSGSTDMAWALEGVKLLLSDTVFMPQFIAGEL